MMEQPQLVLMSSDEAKKRGLEKLVSIKSWASCGVDPALMGTGPIPSAKKALDQAGWTVNDVDFLKLMKPLQLKVLAVIKTLVYS